jgi:hypothetical protein
MIDLIFDASVQLLRIGAKMLGISYQAINVWVFCVIWPLLTLALVALIIIQHQKIRRLRQR